MTTEYKRMQQLRGSSDDWGDHNIAPLDGEIAIERSGGQTRLKIGDGATPYAQLGYIYPTPPFVPDGSIDAVISGPPAASPGDVWINIGTGNVNAGWGAPAAGDATAPGDQLIMMQDRSWSLIPVHSDSSFIQEGTGAVPRSAQDKMREIASDDDFDGTFATALANANDGSPILNGYGGIYLPGWTTIDPDRFLTTSMLPSLANSRAPLFVLANPGPADLIAGYSAGAMIWVGDNPTATPGAGDVAGQTIAVINGNNRQHLYGMNIVVGQSAAPEGLPADYIDGSIHGLEIDLYSSSAFTARNRAHNATSGSFNKNGLEIVASNGPSRLTAAAMIWSDGQTGASWWHEGISISRCLDLGLHFLKNPTNGAPPDDSGVAFGVAAILDESDSLATLRVTGNHGSIIDLSGNPGFANFVLGSGTAGSVLNFKNDADFSMGIAIDSGGSAADASVLNFNDRGVPKWQIVKNNGNNLFFNADPTGSVVTAMVLASGGGGAVGIGGIAPSYNLDVNGVTKLGGQVGFQGNNPIAKPAVTGAKGGNAALASLITALASYGLITDSTT